VFGFAGEISVTISAIVIKTSKFSNVQTVFTVNFNTANTFEARKIVEFLVSASDTFVKAKFKTNTSFACRRLLVFTIKSLFSLRFKMP
jgi:hypothetical protein